MSTGVDAVLLSLKKGVNLSRHDLDSLGVRFEDLDARAHSQGYFITVSDRSDDPFEVDPDTPKLQFLDCRELPDWDGG